MMSKDMENIIYAMQLAVDEEMERKAKLGYDAVIADKNGMPKIVSAKYLVRKRRAKFAKFLKELDFLKINDILQEIKKH